jgi:RES domain-containing protein
MVYAATHVSLALLEQFVHVNPDRLPDAFCALAIEVPDDAPLERLTTSVMLDDLAACRRYGDAWATSHRSAVLVVPSALVAASLQPGAIETQERNVLLNPRHATADAWQVIETSFRVDARLRRTG